MTTERKKPQDRLPSKKKARTRTLYFPTDLDAAEKLQELRNQDGVASLLGKANAEAEEARLSQIAELEASLRRTSVKIVIKSLSRVEYEKLLADHPPTEEQLESFKNEKQKPSFNFDTYPIALICASVIDPKAPSEELEEWFNGDEWTGGEITELFSACVSINSQSNVLTLGKG